MKKFTAAILISALTCAAACYGPFNLTRKLHKRIGELEGKWQQEGVFLVCALLPVYGITVLVDAVALNSIEFWGGENPVKAEYINNGTNQAVTKFDRQNNKMSVALFKNNRPLALLTIKPDANGSLRAQSSDGRSFFVKRSADGSVTVLENNGRELARYAKGEVPALN